MVQRGKGVIPRNKNGVFKKKRKYVDKCKRCNYFCDELINGEAKNPICMKCKNTISIFRLANISDRKENKCIGKICSKDTDKKGYIMTNVDKQSEFLNSEAIEILENGVNNNERFDKDIEHENMAIDETNIDSPVFFEDTVKQESRNSEKMNNACKLKINREVQTVHALENVMVETVMSDDENETFSIDNDELNVAINGTNTNELEMTDNTHEEETLDSEDNNFRTVNGNDFNNSDSINESSIVRNNSYCANCKRWDTCIDSEDNELKRLYEIRVGQYIIKRTSLRRKFSTLTMNDVRRNMLLYTSDTVHLDLCPRCYSYFSISKHTKTTLKESSWQIIIWKILSSNELYNIYGFNLWRIVPIEWRRWWLRSVSSLLPNEMYPFQVVCNIVPAIVDVTVRKENLENSIKDGELGKIINSCDENLLPVVKCPWGCTEYYHLSGVLNIETIFCRYILNAEVTKFMSGGDEKHYRSITSGCRNDYLNINAERNDDFLLCNPSWRIAPSVCFIGTTPYFLTCRLHNKGSKKNFLHPPKNPLGTLPGSISDQIAAAVVVPRTIRPTKAHKFSHSYNMQEIRCQFNGVDTLSVTDRPAFNNDSILNKMYECLAIHGREDVRCHVASLSKSNKNVSADLSLNLLQQASEMKIDNVDIDHYDTGSSFISVKDAIELQREVKKGRTKTIQITLADGSIKQYHYVAKWPKSVFYVHNIDSYGTAIPCTPKPSLLHSFDTRILWILQSMHVCVREIWENSSSIVISSSEWYGWLLLFATECSFPRLLKRNTRQKVFSWGKNKSKYDKERKLFQVMNVIEMDPVSNINEDYITNVNAVDVENDVVRESFSNNEDGISEYHGSDLSEFSGQFSLDEYEDHNDGTFIIDGYDVEPDGEQSHHTDADVVGHNDGDNQLVDLDNNGSNEIFIHRGEQRIDNDNTEFINREMHGEDDNALQRNEEASANNNLSYEKLDLKFLKLLFNKRSKVVVIDSNHNWRDETDDENINVLIFLNTNGIINSTTNIRSTNNEYYNYIPRDLAFDNAWQLRYLCFTKDSVREENINKWTGNIYCRHGEGAFINWWKLCSDQVSAQKVKDDFDIYNVKEKINGTCNLAVFVRTNNRMSTEYRNTFLKTIGGQTHILCRNHKIPLVFATGKQDMSCCYVNPNNEAERCKRKNIYASCPVVQCCSCICMSHFKTSNSSIVLEISPIVINDIYEESKTYSLTTSHLDTTVDNVTADDYYSEPQFVCDFDCNSSDESEATIEILNLDDKSLDSVASFMDENNNEMGENIHDNPDNATFLSEAEAPLNEYNSENLFCIPCSSAGAQGGMYISEETRQTFIGCHVILNNCGMLLARRGTKLNGTRLQQRFMQSIVAQSKGRSIPLLYPEALLFPSIFWKENKSDSSPVGAIPCCLLAQDSSLSNNGFASLLQHFRARITNTSLLTSTDPRYIAFCFDNFLNLQSRHTHTRLILHRGLWNSGLGRSIVASKESMLNVDSIESRPVVNKLAAAVADEQATYFYTHTCNQEDHFGIRRLKKWLDSTELETIIKSNLLNVSGIAQNIDRYHTKIKTSIIQSAAVVLLRNWMEVSSIWMNYIQNSKEEPLGKVKRIWWRHEYQDTKGNLSHIHALIWIDKNEDKEISLKRIRGSTLDLIADDEVDMLVKQKILKESEGAEAVREKATKLLRHVCSERCKIRTGINKNDVKCRVTNNGIENPIPNYHYFKEYEVPYSNTCTEILNEIGLMHYNDTKKTFTINENLKAVKHYPPAVGGEGNMSPCNGRLFAACLSNNNLKYVTNYLASRYLAKYVASVDFNNRVYLSSNGTEPSEIRAKMEFLHNTKITTSAINETRKHERSKNKNKPHGRAISLMEIIATLLGYPQVFTDINFIHIPTVPLAERTAIEKEATIKKTKIGHSYTTKAKIDDFDAGDLLPQFYIRNIKMRNDLPLWRQYTKFECLLMKDQLFSNLSIDNVTLFGLRPPELRFVRNIKQYFKWFYSEKVIHLPGTFNQQSEFFDRVTKNNINQTMWINGINQKIYLRMSAINEVIEYINTRNEVDFYGSGQAGINTTNELPTVVISAKVTILQLFQFIKEFIDSISNINEIPEENMFIAEHYLNMPNIKLLREKATDPLPVIWFSSIKPSHGTRWLLHLMISMGEFENEYHLYCQGSLKECFVFCKLLSPDYRNHDKDVKDLACRYIIEQLHYIPGGSKQFDRNVIAAYQTLNSFFVLDTPITMEMPPVLYTQLQESITKECNEYLKTVRKRLLETTFTKISLKSKIVLPSVLELISATKTNPIGWNPMVNMSRGETQSNDSQMEQTSLMTYGCERLNMLLAASSLCNSNLIICGGPGVGKTTLLQLLVLYAASVGLNVNLTSVMSERSLELGGMHISKMFCIPTDRTKNPSIISEKAVCALLRNPKQFALIQKMEVLAIDKFGQVSAELLSVIDIILRTIRKNSLFMGGVYIISTMDHLQLPPVNGRPPLLSPHMLSSFTVKILFSSVRASQDDKLQEIQQITRMSYNELEQDHIDRFRYLIENYCTFVNDFDDPLITTEKLRMFGKKSAKVLAEETLLRAKQKEYNDVLIECFAEDFESTLESQWDIASSTTSRLLSQKVKEPYKLCFYPFAVYEITFNSGSKYSQGQIAILAEMPTAEDVKNFAPVAIYVAPDGCKTFPSEIDVSCLIRDGWRKNYITKCREHPEILSHRVQAKRRQYGLRHRIASTIHAGMGQDLQYIVTKVTDVLGDPTYHLWDREQVVVLLSRTNFAKDIIFVGDKTETSKALSDLLKKRSQYTEYINEMLLTLSKSKENTTMIPYLKLDLFPYRIVDFEIPIQSSGYVYLIQSRNPHFNCPTYIGETNNIVRRIREHNQLRGSNSTCNPLLLPWALICFITGFCNTEKYSRRRIELMWKMERDKLKKRLQRPVTIEEMCNIGKRLILESKNEDLRLIICTSLCS